MKRIILLMIMVLMTMAVSAKKTYKYVYAEKIIANTTETIDRMIISDNGNSVDLNRFDKCIHFKVNNRTMSYVVKDINYMNDELVKRENFTKSILIHVISVNTGKSTTVSYCDLAVMLILGDTLYTWTNVELDANEL